MEVNYEQNPNEIWIHLVICAGLGRELHRGRWGGGHCGRFLSGGFGWLQERKIDWVENNVINYNKFKILWKPDNVALFFIANMFELIILLNKIKKKTGSTGIYFSKWIKDRISIEWKTCENYSELLKYDSIVSCKKKCLHKISESKNTSMGGHHGDRHIWCFFISSRCLALSLHPYGAKLKKKLDL